MRKLSQCGVTRDSRAVVTGAGSGIGRAICLELAARGAQVVCSDLSLALAEETAALIQERGGMAYPVHCDVSVRADVEDLAQFAQTRMTGPVSLLVNNAGIAAGGGPVGALGFDEWRRAIDINLWGPIHGCEVFVPVLRSSGSGGIINIASAAAFGAAPLMGPYCVSKSGVLALSEVLAAELAGTDITVSVVCPTLVKTNIVKNADDISSEIAKHAQKLMDTIGYSPERIARIILNSHDRGKLYIVPQIDAKLAWRVKRHFPRGYLLGMKLFNRLVGSRASSTQVQ